MACDGSCVSWALFPLALSVILSSVTALHCTLWSPLGHNQLSWLSYSEWGRVGTLAPAGRSGSGPGCQSYSQRMTSTQTRGATRETGGCRGQAGVLVLSLFPLMCWRRLVACGTDNTQAPDTQPWSHHTRPGTRAQSWENRAELRALWSLGAGSSSELVPPACAARPVLLSRAAARASLGSAVCCGAGGVMCHVCYLLRGSRDVSRSHTSRSRGSQFCHKPSLSEVNKS